VEEREVLVKEGEKEIIVESERVKEKREEKKCKR
jgi:hypothetical protein